MFIDSGGRIGAAGGGAEPRYECDEPEPNSLDMYQDFGHSHWHNALLWGENIENVSIGGPGLIHGKGLVRNHNNQTPLTIDKIKIDTNPAATAADSCQNVRIPNPPSTAPIDTATCL